MNDQREVIAAALPAYEVGEQMGRGAFGRVFAGRHRQLDRPVAIKQLAMEYSADPEVRARFLAEARLLATLDHPHVVPVYDYVEQGGLCLLVMEKLSGGTVLSRAGVDGVRLETASAVALAAASGLHHAHGRGVLHRDVKPENLLFSASGVLKVTDFGIAKVVGGAKTSITTAGQVVGTPAYMAPEQARGDELAPDTDVYGLGTTVFELLAGRLPYSEEGDVMAVLYRHVHEDPVPLGEANAAVPAQVRDVVMRAIARDRHDRYRSAQEFGAALAEASVDCWGPEWLSRVDPPVPAGGPVDGLVQRAISTPRSSPAVPPEARGATGPLARRSRRRAERPPAAVAEPKPAPVPPTPEPVVAEEPSGPEDGSRKRRVWVLALVLALVLGVLGAVVLAGGGGDGGDSGDTTETCEDGSEPVGGECPEPRHCEDGSHAVDGKCPEDEASPEDTTPEETTPEVTVP